MVGDARAALGAGKEAARRAYLRANARTYALVMFSRTSCGYCRVQWPIAQRFQEEYGWQVIRQDLDAHPELGQRFGVEVTPTTMVIKRDSQQRMTIASGVEAYPSLSAMAYQAVRLLNGDIRPEQFMTGAGQEGGQDHDNDQCQIVKPRIPQQARDQQGGQNEDQCPGPMRQRGPDLTQICPDLGRHAPRPEV